MGIFGGRSTKGPSGNSGNGSNGKFTYTAVAGKPPRGRKEWTAPTSNPNPKRPKQ